MDQPVSRQPGQPFVERLKSDDAHTLKTLYTNHLKAAMHYIVQNSGSMDDARDSYQEAFVAVWRNVQLGRFAPKDESEFAAYLIRVVKNKWIDELRKRKNRHNIPVEGEGEADAASADEPDETDAYIDIVKEQYKHLGARCRELLGRFYFLKQPLREIAAVFEWTEASAKNNKYRCLKQLRELVLRGGERS